MRKKTIKLFLAVSLVLSIICPPPLLLAQQADPFTAGAKSKLKLPKNAIIGSNAERRAAWEKLSETEKNQRLEKFKAILENAKIKALKDKKAEKPSDTVLTFTYDNKSRKFLNAKTREVKAKDKNDGSATAYLRPAPCDDCDPLPDPTPEPTPPPQGGNQYPPIGFLDGIDVNAATINGWSFDPDNPSVSNDVHIYIDGPAGSGTGFAITASQPRPDVNQAYGISGDHGYSFQIPPQYADGQQHAVYAYGIDTGANPPTLLNGSPKYFTLNGNPPPPSGNDTDVDGLDDNFESALSDGFTPFYHVSANENAGTGFATFNNSLPLSINQLFSSVPPISYYRAKPLGTGSINGTGQYGFVQLDYLTLWNKDDGLIAGGFCYFLAPAIGLSLDVIELGSHQYDRERSAILVAAPLVNGAYSTNIYDYRAYKFFTVAHEDTFFDHSLLFYPQEPVNFGAHIELAFSQSKHSTYPYNPDYQPLFPDYVIASTYAGIEFSYAYGEISFETYLDLLYIADTVLFTCAVEHFQEQGGSFAGMRINVGELSHPINNSGFILDSEIANKLQKLF